MLQRISARVSGPIFAGELVPVPQAKSFRSFFFEKAFSGLPYASAAAVLVGCGFMFFARVSIATALFIILVTIVTATPLQGFVRAKRAWRNSRETVDPRAP